MPVNEPANSLLEHVGMLAAKYRLRSLAGSIAACEALAQDSTLNVAVFGRFKAGKSSFLNELIGQPLLPSGVTPVTGVVSEIAYGIKLRATVDFLDGRDEDVAIDGLRGFVAEADNPENIKGVARVSIELPGLEKYRGIRFLDTPGLESTLTHNSEVTRDSLPQAGLAIVAVGVDPPLSERDVALIRDLSVHTPRLCVLLTKADLLSRSELADVFDFVHAQLRKQLVDPPRVFPYSVRAGYEDLRSAFESSVLQATLSTLQTERDAILKHKLASVARECQGYLQLALKAIESREAEQDSLRKIDVGDHVFEEEAKLQLRMVAQHTNASCSDPGGRGIGTALKRNREPVAGRVPGGVFPVERDPGAAGSRIRRVDRRGLEERNVAPIKKGAGAAIGSFVPNARASGTDPARHSRTDQGSSRTSLWRQAGVVAH